MINIVIALLDGKFLEGRKGTMYLVLSHST